MTTPLAAYCGHDDCVQAVNDWIAAGHPDVTYERLGAAGVMTHRSEVLFYARRDHQADGYETAVAEGRPYTEEQRGSFKMRDRARQRREWRARQRGKATPAA
ncbi:hypothetical protein [Streptomyces sp. KN37]|uniref:hypothetical protein n=1 Tax=Streptomyces sp. KN37 TaxID=3090667 RepID=UPI002A75E1B4|nr:hypothetical protein [Streptomyces sp. KN37]WPO70243.1 hypothetical protein R9806_06170 [Streptomyces sp. KN37]